MWVTVANAGARLLTIASTFVLTRFIAPDVQGEVNLAFVMVTTAGIASSLGVGQYVAAHPKETRDTTFHGTVLVLGSGAIACALCIALGPGVARWLDVPGMARYVPGLVLGHFLERCGWLPRSLLVRDMQFRKVGVRVALGELLFAVSSVLLACLGLGGFAIVGGNLARATGGLVYILSVTNFRDHLRPCRLKLATFARILRFGVPITLSQFFRVAATTWDNTFMGATFGGATVGVYNQAYRLAELPSSSIGDPANDVLVPTFARLADPADRRRGYLRAASLLALLVLPMACGLGVIAPALVEVFYPRSFAGVAPFLMVLAPLSVARAICSLSSAFLQVTGRTQRFIAMDLALLAMVLGFMTALSRWGAVGAASGIAAAFFLNLALMLRALRSDGITISSVFLAVSRPLLACAPMVVAVLAVRYGLTTLGVGSAARLLAQIVAGAATYVVAAWLLAPVIAHDFLDLVGHIVRGRRGRRAEEPGSDAARPEHQRGAGSERGKRQHRHRDEREPHPPPARVSR
jgi:PST family polysaccharide transporter